MFYIYGKYEGQKRFYAMDINKGAQVPVLVRATRLTAEERDRFLQHEAPRNPQWQFEARPIRATRGVPDRRPVDGACGAR